MLSIKLYLLEKYSEINFGFRSFAIWYLHYLRGFEFIRKNVIQYEAVNRKQAAFIVLSIF